MTERELLARTADIAADYIETLETRSVYPRASVEELREALDGTLPEAPQEPFAVLDALAQASEPGVVASQSGRYFGFVVGGSLPVALAADWLVSTWDQNLGFLVLGPSAVVMENIAGESTRSCSASLRTRRSPS